MTSEDHVKKCNTCYGYGLWAVGDPCPMGPMDFSDGCPSKECPECGMGGPPENYWKTLDGRIIKLVDLEDAHLDKIIKHIKARDHSFEEQELLNRMIKEQNRRKK